jgi:hypothetical protein
MQLTPRRNRIYRGSVRTQSLYPRLEQLNRELMRERSKTFDYIYLVGNGYRYRVCVMASGSGFSASVQIGARVLRHDSISTPANAVQQLAISAKAYIATRTDCERHFLREDCRRVN